MTSEMGGLTQVMRQAALLIIGRPAAMRVGRKDQVNRYRPYCKRCDQPIGATCKHEPRHQVSEAQLLKPGISQQDSIPPTKTG